MMPMGWSLNSFYVSLCLSFSVIRRQPETGALLLYGVLSKLSFQSNLPPVILYNIVFPLISMEMGFDLA